MSGVSNSVLLMLEAIPFHGLMQRHQHIARELSAYMDVIYVESTPSVIKRMFDGALFDPELTAYKKGLQKISDRLHLFKSPPCTPRTFGYLKSIESTSERTAKALIPLLPDGKEIILWLCSPSAAPALGLYNEKFTLFDCFDAWGEFPGEEKYREGIEDALNRAGTKVDIILTTAPELQQKLSHLNQNTFLIRNGCDPDHYNNPGIIPSGGDRLYDPDDLPRPVIGYMGDIAPWLELDHIYNAAERHPDWSFVMLGTWKRDDKLPSSLPNILAPGRVNYDELPFYVRGFDVGTIPFALNELTRVVNPLKLYEYFSLGMPVVSTPIPEVARNEDLVYLAGTPDEFVMLLEVAVKEPADKEVRGKRIAVARENSWNSRAREIIKLISERKG